MSDATGRAASLYVRLSQEASESNLSLEGMEQDLRALAARLDRRVHAVHVDNGRSGAIRDRAEFQAWLEDARSGAVDTLLTYHADRLTREGVNVAARVLDVVEGKDPESGKVVRQPVRLVDCKGLDSQSGDDNGFRFNFVIAAEVARAERQRISSRQKDARRRLREQGRHTGQVPYGTRSVPREGGGRMLEVYEPEAYYLRESARRLLRGDTLRSVVGWLNKEGIRPRRADYWQRKNLVKAILSDTSRRLVFDLATHDKLRADLRPNSGREPRSQGRPRKYLMTGFAECGSCGAKMASVRGTYRCGRDPDMSCTTPASIKTDWLDAYIEREYLAVFGPANYYETRTEVIGGEDLDAVARTLEAAQKALTEEPTTETLGRFQEAKAAYDRAAAEPPRTETRLVPTGKTIADLWAEWDQDARAGMLRGDIEWVKVHRWRPGIPKTPEGATRRIEMKWREDGELDA